MKLKLIAALVISALIGGAAFAAKGTINFNNVNLSINENNPTHSPGFTMPDTATGFDVIITTNPTWVALTGQGGIHCSTEMDNGDGTWSSIGNDSFLEYGSHRKDGTPQGSYGISRSDLHGKRLRVTAWSDVHIVVQVVGAWDFD